MLVSTRRSCVAWILIAGIALLGPVVAHAEVAAVTQLKSTVDEALRVIADKSLDSQARRDRIRTQGERRFAMKQMSGLVLGANWKSLDAEQRKEFVAIFTDTLLDSYMRKIETYSGETFTYGDAKISGKKGVLPTVLNGSERSIPVVYKVFLSGKEWKVYDVEIDGVSVVKTYRTQYGDFLAEKSFDELTATMKSKLGANK